jgi:regulator of protease activity HflC (stomatin/prohibitin superfamily)
VDRARLVVKLSLIGGILSAVFFTLVMVIGIVNENFVGSDVFALALIPCTMSMLFAAAAFIYGLLNKYAAIENEEKFLLENRKQNRALDVEEDVRFTSGRSFDNFRKYAPYVLTILAALAMGFLLFVFARYWSIRVAGRAMPLNSLNAALISMILALISIFSGAFFVGQSRTASFRWLRPLGSWLIVAAAIFFGAGVSSIFNYYQVPAADGKIANVAWWIFAILGVEFLTSFIIEFYRPRTLEEPRPLFESRLLTLFTEPGGVMRNMAEALDYQFGFKVSGTWIYAFIEKSLFPLVIVWAAILWFSTSIYEVNPEEIGIRERFGRVVSTTPLEPGIYFELPWPFGNINRFSCTRLREVVAGIKDNAITATTKTPEAILWTKTHITGENYFIVAVEADKTTHKESPEATDAQSRHGRENVAPVSLLGLHMPVQYRIRKSGIIDYAYKNRDPDLILKRISEQVATEYMASCSLMHIMADSRHQAANEMHRRIQRQADAENLGIEIVAVNILDVHPPVEKVAPEFQAVIGAMEKKETMILNAQADAEVILPEAEARYLEILQTANSYKYNTVKVAEAESLRFSKQLESYRAMPEMFKLNSLLSLLEKDTANIRKFIISSSMQNEIYELNFEEKERLDLIDANLGSIGN